MQIERVKLTLQDFGGWGGGGGGANRPGVWVFGILYSEGVLYHAVLYGSCLDPFLRLATDTDTTLVSPPSNHGPVY
jgi:hypothetical protein